MPLFEPSIVSISAGTTWATGPGVSFSNANGISFGVSGNTITASVLATFSTANIAIAAGTETATSGTVFFSNSNGVSFGLNNSTLTASFAQPISVFSQWGGFETNYTISNAMLSFQKVSMPMSLSGSSGVVLAALTGHSDSSGAITISIGAYTISGLTASALATTSAAFSWGSGSDTSASSLYGGVSGTRYRSFGWAVPLAPGDYLFAFAISTTNDGTLRLFGRQGVNIVGTFAGAETAYFLDGISISSSAALPSSVVASDTGYVRTGLRAAQQPGFILIGIT